MESWKSVPGFAGKYEISDLGRIKSLPLIQKFSNNSSRYIYPMRLKEIILKLDVTAGEPTVVLRKLIGSQKFRVKRLVWEAFNGPLPEGFEIKHKNRKLADCRLCNLILREVKVTA